jgi:phosphatidate phosphatase
LFVYPQVCQPIMPDGTDCSNPLNLNKYIEEFTCGNTEISDVLLREMRLSFPSGHTTFSSATMLFAVVCRD